VCGVFNFAARTSICNTWSSSEWAILSNQFHRPESFEKLLVTQLVKNFPFYGIRSFLTVFTRAATGPYPELDESTHTFLTYFLRHSNFIFPSTPRSSEWSIPCVLHVPILSFIWSVSLYSVNGTSCETPGMLSSLTSHHFLPVLSHPQSRSSLSVWDQVSHPYKTTGKATVLYVSIFKFLGRRKEDKRLNRTAVVKPFPDFNLIH